MDVSIPRRKAELRRVVVERILALDPAARRSQQAALENAFETLPGLARARRVLVYAPAFPEEIDTWPMVTACRRRGQRLVFPRVDRTLGGLCLHEVVNPSADFRAGILGIPEPRRSCPVVDPVDIDWALVPGIAFDARGYRLGRGAGHYDRLLPRLRPEAPRWALCFDAQWVDELPAEPHDARLDGVISPGRVSERARLTPP